MTPLLQPADVSWMRPLKVAYFKKWNHWLVHAPKAFTASGNVKSPGYAKVITWISEILVFFQNTTRGPERLLALTYERTFSTQNLYTNQDKWYTKIRISR